MIFEQIIDRTIEEITEETACRIIAARMGYRDAFNPCDGDYTKSEVYKYRDMNRLPEVMEKIGLNWEFEYDKTFNPNTPYQLEFWFKDIGKSSTSTGIGHTGTTFREAFLFGIAKAIRALQVREAIEERDNEKPEDN